MDVHAQIGVGVADLQQAVRAEVDRIRAEVGSDPLAQTNYLHHRLRELDLIDDHEVEVLSRLAELSSQAARGATGAHTAYLQAREMYNTMLAGKTSPVALVIASSSVGSYTVSTNPDGSGTVVMARSTGEWEHRGAAAGAVIGSIWGPEGAAVGAAVGGLVGAAVDHCTK